MCARAMWAAVRVEREEWGAGGGEEGGGRRCSATTAQTATTSTRHGHHTDARAPPPLPPTEQVAARTEAENDREKKRRKKKLAAAEAAPHNPGIRAEAPRRPAPRPKARIRQNDCSGGDNLRHHHATAGLAHTCERPRAGKGGADDAPAPRQRERCRWDRRHSPPPQTEPQGRGRRGATWPARHPVCSAESRRSQARG